MLSDQGVKELTLLGQNVNSYADLSQLEKQLGTASPAGISERRAADPFSIYAKASVKRIFNNWLLISIC